MIRKVFILIGYLLLSVFMVVTLSFVANENHHITCLDLQVVYDEHEFIQLRNDEIISLITKADEQILGKELRSINTETIEQAIEMHPAIKNAEVFKIAVTDSVSYKGVLGVRVQHREPRVRVISANGSYYLDAAGEKIPLSSSYTANVLVATGKFSEEYARRELLPFILFINEDPFWNAQIEQVHVDLEGGIHLVPLVGDQIIEMGAVDDFPEKLRNLKAFYEQVLTQNNWDKYHKISLRYKNQIIAKKR